MKYILITTLAIYANQSTALVIWPDTTAPCNTTLTACADALPLGGEVIEIRTNGPINQSLSTNRGVSLVAGKGFKPMFSAGHGVDISGTSHGDLEVTISGLTFVRGSISYNARGSIGTTTKLNITNNHIIDNSSPNSSIRINNFGYHSLDINIAYNQVTYNKTVTGLENSGAIAISNGIDFGLSSSAELTGRVYNNQIKSVGDESIGIGIYEISESSSDLDVSSNEFIGGDTAAMYAEKKSDSTGISRIDFAHNAIYSNQIDDNYRGMMAEVAAGELEINAINNTITNAFDGFNFQETDSGELKVRLYNNIVAFSGAPVILNFYNISDSTIALTNDNNLFFNNELADPDYIPGPAFISTDPLFKSSTNARLNIGSPAIEAGNSFALLAVASTPLIDADGLNRIKKGDTSPGAASVDIGAYETGDLRKLDIFKNTNTHVNNIESQAINMQTNSKLQVTHNWNPLTPLGILNNANFGVFKVGITWNIFNQDMVQMTANTAFNVWSPAQSINSFVHTATDAGGSSESSTMLTSGGTMNNPDAILAVTQLWESAAGAVYNDNPVGAFYDSFNNQWRINNTNLVDMPLDAKFNVYYQAASANAFVHQAVTENTFASITLIDHRLLNGSPCAQFQITHVGLTINPYPTGVYYNSINKQWGIFNQGGDPMANNAKFHVILSPEQIAECSDIIFANSFE